MFNSLTNYDQIFGYGGVSPEVDDELLCLLCIKVQEVVTIPTGKVLDPWVPMAVSRERHMAYNQLRWLF